MIAYKYSLVIIKGEGKHVLKVTLHVADNLNKIVNNY
jgi:hypothetical protein